MTDSRIIRIESGRLESRRPRKAGSNARLGEHGLRISLPIVRVTLDNGESGFGACHSSQEQAAGLVGKTFDEIFFAQKGVSHQWQAFQYPLWDLAGKQAGAPVYQLAAAITGTAVQLPYRAPCYDTSLYFDDLHLETMAEAAALLAAEAREGYEQGHRAFKIKVGRGARHLPLEEGTARDIAVVHAVREAVGPGPPLMLDANNGYNLNLAKRVLAETAGCGIYWMEEAFHEDPVLYRDLQEWLKAQNLPVLIADGEGQASPTLLEWARQGLVDVIQHDIFGHGFTRWLETGTVLDSWGVRSAPHHYGSHYGNCAACHLAGALRHFTYVEWDDAHAEGLDTSAYSIAGGQVTVPDRPGFGLDLNESLFQQAVTAGYTISS